MRLLVAPDHGTEESRLGEIVFQVVVTDDDIAQPPLPIGNADGYEDESVGDRLDFCPMGVGQREEPDRRPVGHRTKHSFRDTRGNWHWHTP